MRAKYYPNLFAAYPEKKGKGWIKALSPEDLQAFTRLGFEYSNYGRDGGSARARTAKRDHRGRFLPKEGLKPC